MKSSLMTCPVIGLFSVGSLEDYWLPRQFIKVEKHVELFRKARRISCALHFNKCKEYLLDATITLQW